ncbi:MAG: TonB-dependent receptor [Saprospirales bacterium]|nr:TonB-dependent receptor [Saprospirales bacterium]MBK8922495.1 TonB-dependent receptor [Saprospirales bacterium]
MNIYKFFLLVCLLPTAWIAGAQRLRGIVRDADRGTPLAGVSISLGQTEDIDHLAITTGADGAFATDALAPGYYRCFFSLKDYEPLLVSEVRIASGKETIIDVAMRTSATALPDVTIKATSPDRRPLQALGEIPLTREQTQRFPATFFDPARLALAYPGVANTDDQANGLTIRGNGPASLRWRLEGVDIVNPNHLPNAGTLGDRPTASSGGVLLFSAQLLDNSSLLTGAFPAGYGDALGGIMDMSWRRGNREQREYTVQAGLVGIDLAAEGPLDKKHRHSYLANYRYSTVGLLGLMGISFGGETINFQDLSCKLDFAGKNGGEWSVFSAGGLSANIFTPPGDTADVQGYKDLFDIEFNSRTYMAGISHWAPLGRDMWWKFSIISSGQFNRRQAIGAGIRENDENTENRFGASATLFRRLNDQNRLQAGINAQHLHFDGMATRDSNRLFNGDLAAALIQPWAAWEWTNRPGHIAVRLGLHTSFFKIHDLFPSDDASIEPRLLLTQRLSKRHTLALGIGGCSQLAPLWMYADLLALQGGSTPAEYPNRTLGFTRAWQANLRYSWQSGELWIMKAELYYQRLREAPVSLNTHDAFSMLNISEIQALPALTARGLGENKGLELSVERYLSKGWFLLVNTTLFDARYRGSDGRWRAARWNIRHIANLTAGKEWERNHWPERLRAFGVNGRLTWAGGQYAAPVDETASAAAKTTVYDLSDGYSGQQPGFVRLDVRVYWRRNIGLRRNSIFAMDFQNVAIRKNVAYRYYDPYTSRVETKTQLGLVPNLSWRLEF